MLFYVVVALSIWCNLTISIFQIFLSNKPENLATSEAYIEVSDWRKFILFFSSGMWIFASNRGCKYHAPKNRTKPIRCFFRKTALKNACRRIGWLSGLVPSNWQVCLQIFCCGGVKPAKNLFNQLTKNASFANTMWRRQIFNAITLLYPWRFSGIYG